MNYQKHLESFKEHLMLLNFSDRSVDTYYKEVTYFINFLEKHYPRITSFEKITKDIIVDYQQFLSQYKTIKGKFLSNKSQRKRIIILKKFFNYLLKNDFILNDPTYNISVPRKEITVVRDIISEKEVKDILKSIKTDSPRNIRDKAILELVYATGMRTTECCNLKVADINLKEQTLIVVRGKGKKSRIIPLTQYATHYIELYLEKARKYFLRFKINDPGYLFLNNRGNPFNANTINKFVLQRILKKVKIKNKHITFYTFRHSIATHLLKNKVDIRYIAQLLGHSSLNTTQVYTHVEISDLKRIHSLTHPREKSV